MAPQEFNRWWNDFLVRLEDNPTPHESARRLRHRLVEVDEKDRHRLTRRVFEELLGRRHDFGLALFLLEGISDPAYLSDIAENLRPLPDLQSDDEESHLADLIRLLCAANDASMLPTIENYLLQRRIGPHWASVPWALWPHRKQLFGRAWCRFFQDRERHDWKSTLLIKSFLIEPEAVRVVRAELEPASPEDWNSMREALVRQAGNVRWLSDQESHALERALQ